MGDPVGVFTNNEVKPLSRKDRALLKEHAVQQLRTSEEIHRIVSSDPKLLPTLLKGHPRIRKILRKNLRPMLDRLHKK